MTAEDDPSSVFLQLDSGSMIRDLVEQVNFTHPVKGRIKSMHVIQDEDTGFPIRFHIEIVYSEVPYPGEHDYSDFELGMETRLQENMPSLIAVPVDIFFHRREAGETEDDEEEEPAGE